MAVITTWTREMDEHSVPAIEGLLHIKLLRSPHPHARIVAIDKRPAVIVRPRTTEDVVRAVAGVMRVEGGES